MSTGDYRRQVKGSECVRKRERNGQEKENKLSIFRKKSDIGGREKVEEEEEEHGREEEEEEGAKREEATKRKNRRVRSCLKVKREAEDYSNNPFYLNYALHFRHPRAGKRKSPSSPLLSDAS